MGDTTEVTQDRTDPTLQYFQTVMAIEAENQHVAKQVAHPVGTNALLSNDTQIFRNKYKWYSKDNQ